MANKDPNAPKPAMPMSIDTVADACWAATFRGRGLEDAIAVVCAEHGGPNSVDAHDSLVNTAALGARGPSIGSIDRGLFMLNSYWHREVSDAVAYEPYAAARQAYRISSGGTDFTQWSTWPNQANRHRVAARAAAERRAGRGGTGTTAGTGVSSTSATAMATATGTQNVSADVLLPAGSIGAGSISPSTPNGMFVTDLQFTRGKLDEMVTGGNVDLTMDEASQITIELYNLVTNGTGISEAPTGARFQWGALGRASQLRVAAWAEQGWAAGTKVDMQVRSDALHQMKTPNPDPTKSDAPSLSDVSPSEYAAAVARRNRLTFHGQGSVRRSSIAPAKVDDSRQETEWEVLTRLADDLGYLLFEVDGVLEFGSAEWLAARATEVKVGWGGAWGNPDLDALERPGYRAAEDNRRDQTLTFTLPRWRGELVRPGMRVNFRGIVGYQRDRGWLVNRVTWPIDAGWGPVRVECFHPDNALRKPKAKLTADGLVDKTGEITGTKSSLDFVTLALAQAGDRYVFGAEASINDQDPSAFDCSELVQWALGRVGVPFTDGTWLQYRAINKAKLTLTPAGASKIRGALLFTFSSNPLSGDRPSTAHVAISLGDGKRTIEAQNTKVGVVIGNYGGRGWTHAGTIPGLDYGFNPIKNRPLRAPAA